jgi:hypothetical protein
MSLYRSALSACVVRGLPNVQDYIYKPPKKEGRVSPNSVSAATTQTSGVSAPSTAAGAAQGTDLAGNPVDVE